MPDVCMLLRLPFPKNSFPFPHKSPQIYLTTKWYHMRTYTAIGLLLLGGLYHSVFAQTPQSPPVPPSVYEGIGADQQGYFLEKDGEKWYEYEIENPFHLTAALGQPMGTEDGIAFNFGPELAGGRIYVGLIPYGDSRYPHPVYRRNYGIDSLGQVGVNLRQFGGRYDMTGWQERQSGTFGYRLMDAEGQLVYDGKVNFEGVGPFRVAPAVIMGPLLHQVTDQSAIVSAKIAPGPARITLVYKKGAEEEATVLETTGNEAEFALEGLLPDTEYEYTLQVGKHSESYSFRTAPAPGSRSAFTFAYASDSRSGQGGGERDVWGANSYIMKKIMALATQQEAAFFQFSGDLINGYLTDPDEMDLQYANWQRAVEPWWHQMPIYISMGNHEALMRVFRKPESREVVMLDRWPFASESAEAVFQRNVVNPTNGPASEDGAAYDPHPRRQDFPSYDESVFYYAYDNVAVIVLNSDYLYAPTQGQDPYPGGGLHAYIMDQQLAWLQETVASLEANGAIDHVFVTQHTPFFPNGGHVSDDMWYGGNNEYRPSVAGKPVEHGIIERRDQLLEILVNESTKVRAILTGDEHNYAKTELGPETNIHPEGYAPEKVTLSRTIWQINNGAAGAPYYAQEATPWTPWVSGFTTQHALVLFDVAGKQLKMRVLNPDTLEPVDELVLVE